MANGEFTEFTRKTIKRRAGGQCELCGMPCTDGQIHHRKPRRAGGSIDPRVSDASNGVYIHASCHGKVESNRHWAIQRGWLLFAAEYPEEVPIRTWKGWVLLSTTGEAREVDAPDNVGPPVDGGGGSAGGLTVTPVPVDDGVGVHLGEAGEVGDGVD
jgi:5-methylcytosine-specific restriction enzyme A